MSFNKYPQYQKSGVKWLGELPIHWNIARNKRVFQIINNKVGSQSKNYQLLSLTLRGVIPRDRDGKGKFPAEFDTYQEVKPGNVIFCLFDIDETPRTVGISSEDGMITGAYTVTEVFPLADPRFVYYYYFNIDLRKGLRPFYTGLRKVVRPETFMNLEMPLPPLAEQQILTKFLDHETAKIDALIREQERLIALLQEKRQAVISHAVTKGLDPNVPMKDSGVEWLGEVPEHWEVVRLKCIARSLKAGPFGSAITKDMYTASGYRVYGQEQVIPGDFKKGDYFISEEYFQQLQQYAVEPGDILISCVGTFGKIAIVPPDIEPGIINPRLIRLRTVPGVAPDFLGAVLKSDVVFEQFSFFSRGGTMDVINIGTLSDIWLPVPPLGAQSSITNHIHNKALEFDTLISAAHQNIDLLGERRSALISAAVTGKIDVRDWQPPTDESTLDPEVVETRSEVTA